MRPSEARERRRMGKSIDYSTRSEVEFLFFTARTGTCNMELGLGKTNATYSTRATNLQAFFFFFFFFFTSPDKNNFFFFPLLSPSSWPLFMMNGSHAASLLSGGRVSCSCSTSCSSSLSHNNGHNLSLCSTVARRQRHLRHLHGGSSGGHFLKKGVPWVQQVLTHPHMGRASRPEEHAKAKHVSVRLQIPNEDRQVVAQDEAARMVVVGNTEYVHTHTHTRLLCFAFALLWDRKSGKQGADQKIYITHNNTS